MVTYEEFVADIEGLYEASHADLIFVRNFFRFKKINYDRQEMDCLLNFYHHLVRKDVKVFYFKLADDDGLLNKLHYILLENPNPEKHHNKSWHVSSSKTDLPRARLQARTVVDYIEKKKLEADVVILGGKITSNFLDVSSLILDNVNHEYLITVNR